jgi:hypothetical protein
VAIRRSETIGFVRYLVPIDDQDHGFSLGSDPALAELITENGGPVVAFDAEPGEQLRLFRVYAYGAIIERGGRLITELGGRMETFWLVEVPNG